MLLATTLVLLVSSVGDPCERRDDILKVRAATSADLVFLRRALYAELKAVTAPRAKGCVAAVAAEAAALAGDRAAALQHLDTMVAGLPALADDVRPHRALLLAELGRAEEARRELAKLDPRASSWRDRLTLLVGSTAEQTATLRRRVSRDPDALGALCDRKETTRCTALLTRFAGSPAAKAREGAPRAWPIAVAMTRVQALIGAARPHRAVDEGLLSLAAYKGAVAATDDLRDVITTAMWRADRTIEALDVTSGFRRGGALVPTLTKARAKTLNRLGRGSEGADLYMQLRDDDGAPGGDRAEAAFFAAFALVEIDDVDGALGAFERAMPLLEGSALAEQARWYLALLLLTSRGDAARALPLLTTLSTTNDKEVRKYRYWQARALTALGRKKEATSTFHALVRQDALDWYGLLSRKELGLPSIKGATVDNDAVILQAASDDDAVQTRLLFALGFDDEARERCRKRAQKLSRPGLPEIGLCQAVDDATFGWRYGGLFPISPDVKDNTLTSSPRWRVSYARPWPDVVDAATKAAGTTPSLLMAIMRTESGFDTNAVSVANARGPLQLLPSVARSVAALAMLPPTVGERLSSPDVAIPLGAHLLGTLSKEHGSILMAAAAYNAGPEPATSWATRFGALPVEVFVERISFKETRNYVKKVLAAEALYRGLAGGTVALALPTTITPAATFTRFPYDE